jgi:hypothetical protein
MLNFPIRQVSGFGMTITNPPSATWPKSTQWRWFWYQAQELRSWHFVPRNLFSHIEWDSNFVVEVAQSKVNELSPATYPRTSDSTTEGGDSEYHQWVRDQLSSKSDLYSLSIRRPTADQVWSLAGNRFKKLTVDGNILLNIRNCEIDELTLAHFSTVTFDKCRVRFLEVQDGAASSINGANTYFGQINLRNKSIARLYLDGCTIRQVAPPTNPAENPFVGDVDLPRTYVVRGEVPAIGNVFRREGCPPVSSPQQLRDMRAHLSARSNLRAAGVFHAIELSNARASEPTYFESFVSWIYEVGSNYGNSMTRPFFWFLFFFCLIAASDLIFNLAEPVAKEDLYGWQNQLRSANIGDRIIKSFVYAGATVFNPLGVLATKSLVIAKTFWFLAFGHVLGLFGLASLALFFIALRRRYKLE